ncbi:uncharacterized protein LOC124917930 [Impatiens glandulifera]|uniref:uncharacterized protein LOC124917930 n=1 Tax=Impatiens glandulifera TaxID=253017 RepID=UPI001FB0E76B|nr:uncharacterized protein LOC124917930 [Impatiens glandulifera]
MDVDLGLIELKKAYADVIMNTVKDASSRIMVSERKAAHFQHELNVAREQGVQTLLQLKRVMDSKVYEAEKISSDQQRKIEELTLQLQEAENFIYESHVTAFNQHSKIEELEAQLQEAEDIVKDLREEIPILQAHLKRAKISNLDYLEKLNSFGLEDKSLTNSITLPGSASEDPAVKVQGACEKTASDSILSEIVAQTKDLASSSLNRSIDENDSNKPTLPVIEVKSNVSEPFRNRRTQRILAFEEKIMAGELWFRNPTDIIDREVARPNNEEAVEDCKKANKRKDIVRIRSTRKGKRTYRKPKTSSLRFLAEQAMIIEQASSVSDEANHAVNQVDAKVAVIDEKSKAETANIVFLIKQENDGTADLIGKHDAQEAKSVASRVIKFTYQRKQKKESLSCNNETFVENKNSQQVAQVVHQENAVEEMKMA